MIQHPFDRSGLASLDDLETPLWRTSFSQLEAIQEEFLAVQPHCPDYPWPKDPLHNCIRVWEYPFIYCNAAVPPELLASSGAPLAVDLGSGATFFPFAVARLGWRVIAVDADLRATSSLDRAIGKVSTGKGTVASLLSDARSITLDAESVDCVYCISVLEHIPDFERVICEAARILRPNGLFMLTFDVDLSGNHELGPAEFNRLMDALQSSFSVVRPGKIIHPLRILTSDNSPYPVYPKGSILAKMSMSPRHMVHFARNAILGRPMPRRRILASTYGTCLRKRTGGTHDISLNNAN